MLVSLLIAMSVSGCNRQGYRARELAVQLDDANADNRRDAIEELRQIGPPAIPALVEVLQHENSSVRASALWILGGIDQPVEGLAPAIIPMLGDSNENVRTTASMVLAEMGTPAVTFLIDALEQTNADARLHAVYTLGEIGEPVDLLIPVFIQCLGDPVWNVRRVSVRALLNIGPEAVPQLNEALNSEHEGIRRFAAIALDQMKHRKR